MGDTDPATLGGKIMRLGIPRAMLYYRYQTLWETYFSQLGV